MISNIHVNDLCLESFRRIWKKYCCVNYKKPLKKDRRNTGTTHIYTRLNYSIEFYAYIKLISISFSLMKHLLGHSSSPPKSWQLKKEKQQQILILGALGTNGFLGYQIVQGTINAKVYYDHLISLLKILHKQYGEEDIEIILDNSQIHRSKKLRKFLPTYAPQLNPIEKLRNSLKSYLCQADLLKIHKYFNSIHLFNNSIFTNGNIQKSILNNILQQLKIYSMISFIMTYSVFSYYKKQITQIWLEIVNFRILKFICIYNIQILKGLNYITKTYMPDQKNIIILNSHPNNFTAFINSIVVASLDDDGAKFTISNKYIINYQYVGSNQLLIGDFDVIKYQINSNLFATILFTDINNGIYFTHFTYNDQGLLLKTTYELFKLINFYDDQFFINSDTKFYKLKVISQQLNGSILQLNVLISTNNQAQYVFAFDLDASRPQYGLPIKKSSTSLLYVLTPYGNWLAMNKIAYIDGNVAIPYTDGEKVVIGIYPLPSDRSSFVKVIPFTHSIFADYHLSTNKDFFMIFNRDIGSNYPYLFVNINFSLIYNQYLVDFYKMRSDPQITLMDSINYQNELVIDLYLNNDFNQIQGQAILQSKSSITETNNVAQNNKFLD